MFKSAFDTFCEDTQGLFEESNNKHNDHSTANEDLKEQIGSLSEKVREYQEQNLEENIQLNDRLDKLKEDLDQSQKQLSEKISEETVKVLNILSETKMELKTDQERIMTLMTADRERMEERTKEINEIFGNLNFSVQEKLEENMKMMVNRYILYILH